MKKIIFSVIIPARNINNYLSECLSNIAKGSLKEIEIIVILNEKAKIRYPDIKLLYLNKGPSEKRNLGAKEAKGRYLAFIDDDAYPSKNWLKSAYKIFNEKNPSAVCGPGITPPSDSVLQKVSGWINAVKIGTGPYTYRFLPEKERLVDDYPSMNFIIKKSGFIKVGGFDSRYWPGEDTKLCLDLTKKHKEKILYSPLILVYHHRRKIFKDHLSQNGRYGFYRGFFAKHLPETSLRVGYFLPAILLIFLLIWPLTFFLNKQIFLLFNILLVLYLVIIVFYSAKIFLKEKNIVISLLFIPSIILTHLCYGARLIQGFIFTKSLK